MKFLRKPLPLLCLFGCLLFASCGTSKHLQTSHSDGWVMNVVLDKGYKLEVLEGNELNIVPVRDEMAASLGYTIFFKPSDGFRLEGMKARLLSIGALEVNVIKRE